MQLINQIASNATFGKVLLGAIPASGCLYTFRFVILEKLELSDKISLTNFTRSMLVLEHALSILSTISFVSLPLSPQKKALFWVVSALFIECPFSGTVVEKCGGSEKQQKIAYKISSVCCLITKIWTLFMFSVAVSITREGKPNLAMGTIAFGAYSYLNRIYLKNLVANLRS